MSASIRQDGCILLHHSHGDSNQQLTLQPELLYDSCTVRTSTYFLRLYVDDVFGLWVLLPQRWPRGVL